MQRLVLILAALAVTGLALGPAEAARKNAKCTENAECKAAKHVAAPNLASAPKRANSANYEPTIERDGYVINRRNDGDPRAGGGGY